MNVLYTYLDTVRNRHDGQLLPRTRLDRYGVSTSVSDGSFSLTSEELLLHVLRFLTVQELATASMVNKQWLRVTADHDLWGYFLSRDFPDHPLPPDRSEYKPAYIHHFQGIHYKYKSRESVVRFVAHKGLHVGRNYFGRIVYPLAIAVVAVLLLHVFGLEIDWNLPQQIKAVFKYNLEDSSPSTVCNVGGNSGVAEALVLMLLCLFIELFVLPVVIPVVVQTVLITLTVCELAFQLVGFLCFGLVYDTSSHRSTTVMLGALVVGLGLILATVAKLYGTHVQRQRQRRDRLLKCLKRQ
eukprot:TRINITY_DN3523_c0_g1_i1.p1 TRINITY_DN3523_c0_g1~~TRINITY_DN3523_c0_g1_i1.p1  ORF type:complete len:297 (+),score=31.85 TRINITY_DN3523_c0_g1_i1:151-1041(+)